MLNKRTVIGIGAGSVITAIGVAALVLAIVNPAITVDETIEIGGDISYSFNAPNSSYQIFSVTGDSFHVNLETTETGLNKDEDFKNEITFEWYVLEEYGSNKIDIQNTGNSELHVTGTFHVANDPLLFTYHILVITAGIVIIGFSAGFSVRKPRGF